MLKRAQAWIAVFAVFLFLAGCSKNNPTAPTTAKEQGKMLLALSASDEIASGQVTISKGSWAQTLPIAIANHTGSISFEGVQVGKWNIQVQLFDQTGAEIYSGSGEAMVTRNATTSVTIRVNHHTGNLEIKVEIQDPSAVERIVFFDAGVPSISTINSDGTNRRDLTILSTDDCTGGTTYRGGNTLVFGIHSGNIDNMRVCLMNLDGSNLRVIAEKILKPRWSWNGNKLGGMITLSGSGELQYAMGVFNPDGSGLQILPLTQGAGSDYFLCWTPDNRILYIHERYYHSYAVYLTTMDGNTRTQITEYSDIWKGFNDCSPDFKTVGIIHDDVYIMNLDGTGLRQLTTTGNNDTPAFNADGKNIVYFHFETRGTDLYTIRSDGTDSRRITNTPGYELLPYFIY